MSNLSKKLLIKYGSGGYIYLPRYTQIFRAIEKDVVDFLFRFNANEVMLPKLLMNDNVESLKRCDCRFESEWNREQLIVTSSKNEKVGLLAHWQCEPIYVFLEEIFDSVSGRDDIKIIFDNSGYSYRLEEKNGIYRPNEFRRIEVFFRGNILSVRRAIHNILEFFVKYMEGFNPERITRPEESFGGKEEVEDVVTLIDGEEIEVVGSHIHFDTFSSVTSAQLNKLVVTACCGISITRLASIIALQEETANTANALGHQIALASPTF